MIQNKLKEAVAQAVLQYIEFNTIIGVGTGSTVKYFIKALGSVKEKIEGVVSSSKNSSLQLKKIGIPLYNLNHVSHVDIYVDSADEIDSHMQMIKGGGGALTQEKIIAFAAKKFICIVDSSKKVERLGKKGPLPVEVIPMARSLVAKELIRLGGLPEHRNGIITDNGNSILDVYNMNIIDALQLEQRINNIPGVVSVGIFAQRKADLVLISTVKGIRILS